MDTNLASWRKTQALYARKWPPRLVWREMDFHAFVCSLVFVSKNQQTARPLLSGVSVLVPPGAVRGPVAPAAPSVILGQTRVLCRPSRLSPRRHLPYHHHLLGSPITTASPPPPAYLPHYHSLTTTTTTTCLPPSLPQPHLPHYHSLTTTCLLSHYHFLTTWLLAPCIITAPPPLTN
ncbi:hypothetical protein Pmani_027622 [Petrolisthes manimaculis]|uniref:Uncharacterized protein n=1 Tax=Petrolisthes manimaculis TaxID=1843537 RepID=A0AAE1P3C8_9EUCA|nr:hypothetical protein Pmani_027622 [Petrolisthes manimaculis]